MKKCGNGNTVCSKKVGLGRDKSWADPHGSDAVMKKRKKLIEKLLRKKESEVGEQNGKDAVAINKEKPWKEFVEEKVIEPVKEFIVKVQELKELEKLGEIIDHEIEAELDGLLWEA